MENVKLIFCGTKESKTEDTSMECYHNVSNEIFIKIDRPNEYPAVICLNKQTAVRLSRELKKQIGKFWTGAEREFMMGTSKEEDGGQNA